jgi:hypothetical protein
MTSVHMYISLACTSHMVDLILMHFGLSLRLLHPLSLEPLQLIGLVSLGDLKIAKTHSAYF